MGRVLILLKENLIYPLLGFLRQGMSPHKLALAISVGLAFGLIPLIGVTTLLCTLAAVPLRINMAVIQTINYIVYPIQILLIIPLMQFGSHMLSIPPIPLSLDQMKEMINTDFSVAFETLLHGTLGGLFAWMVIIVPLATLAYWIFRKLFIRFLRTN
jgi:uncharacterized protein (DUF2062 family)